MDYLDAMIEAYVKALDDGVNANKSLYETRRIAMKAAYDAAQQVHWGNPLVRLGKPRDLKWTDCPASEPATVRYIDKIVDDPLEKDAAFDREEAVAWFNAIFQTNEKIADAVVKDAGLYGVGMTKTVCAGDGVALMSISHPDHALCSPRRKKPRRSGLLELRERCVAASRYTPGLVR